jgi:toxin ParE1/3/4
MAGYRVTFSRHALTDLASIRTHIARARTSAFADSFVDRIVSYCQSFSEFPHRGTLRDEIRPGLRTVGWRRTVTVAFRVNSTTEEVLILGVLYRGRDLARVLRRRG